MEEKVNNYCVEVADTLSDLVERVNRMGEIGYDVAPGFFVRDYVNESGKRATLYYQPLVKERRHG